VSSLFCGLVGMPDDFDTIEDLVVQELEAPNADGLVFDMSAFQELMQEELEEEAAELAKFLDIKLENL